VFVKRLPTGEILRYLSLERSGIHDVTYKIIHQYMNKKLICNIFWGNYVLFYFNVFKGYSKRIHSKPYVETGDCGIQSIQSHIWQQSFSLLGIQLPIKKK